MKKHVFIAVAILVSVLGASAQSVNIKWYPKVKVCAPQTHSFLGVSKEYAYQLINEKGWHIQKLDKNFTVIEEKLIPEMEYGGYKLKGNGLFNAYDVICVGNNAYILFNCYDRVNYKQLMLVSKIKEDLSIEQPRAIASFTPCGGSQIATNATVFETSENGNYVFYFQRCQYESFAMVFDKDMKELWKTNYQLPWLEAGYLTMSNDGTYIVGNGSNDLLIITADKYTATTAEVGEKHVNNVLFKAIGNTVVMAGSYTTNEYTDDAEAGIFISRYDVSTNQMKPTEYYPYLSKTFDKLEMKDRKMENKRYRIIALVVSETGHITAISERDYTKRKCYADQFGTNCYDELVLGEKIVSGISSTNEKVYEEVVNNTLKINAPINMINGAFEIGTKSAMIYAGGVAVSEGYNIALISNNGNINPYPLQFDEPIDLSKWNFSFREVPSNRLLLEGEMGCYRKYGIINLD